MIRAQTRPRRLPVQPHRSRNGTEQPQSGDQYSCESCQTSSFPFRRLPGDRRAFTAIAHHIGPCKSAHHLEPCRQDNKIVEESDHRNEARDQLNGTEDISHRECGNHARVPRRARIFENEPDNIDFVRDLLCLCLPAPGNAVPFPTRDDFNAVRSKVCATHTAGWIERLAHRSPQFPFASAVRPIGAHDAAESLVTGPGIHLLGNARRRPVT